MNVQNFFNWLFSDAGAGWVFGIVSLIGLAITYYRSNLSKKVIVQELSKTTLLNVSSDVADRIQVSFDNKKIKALGQIKYEIFNNGKDVIANPKLQIMLPNNSTILYVSDDDTEEFPISKSIRRNILELQ